MINLISNYYLSPEVAGGTMTSRAFLTNTLLSVLVLCTGCGGGGGPVDNNPVDKVPIAVAKAEPLVQIPGADIVFSGADSYDPDGGSISKYEWDWDNDGLYDAQGVKAKHSWTDKGSHEVQLRVIDDGGTKDMLDLPLTVHVDKGWAYTWGGALDDESRDEVMVQDKLYILGDYWAESYLGPDGSDLTVPGSNVSMITIDGTWAGSFQVNKDIKSFHDAPTPAVALAVDQNGRICVAGNNSWYDAYVRCFKQDGSLINEKIYKGSNSSNSYSLFWSIAVAIDQSSIFYVDHSGSASWHYVYPGNTPVEEYDYINASSDIFKFDSNFNKLEDISWPSYSYGDYGSISDIALGEDGSYYYVGVVSPEGATLQYGTDLKNPAGSVVFGESNADASKMALQSDGTIFIAGHFYTSGGLYGRGQNDSFLTKINPDKSIAWDVNWGGPPNSENATGVAVDSNGNAYVIGWFDGTADFDTSVGVYEVTAKSAQDAFVFKVDPDGVSKWVRTFGGNGEDKVNPTGIVSDSAGCLYLYGTFEGSIDVDPTIAQSVRQSGGKEDIFLIKMLPGGNW
jgi:hypothetical protein